MLISGLVNNLFALLVIDEAFGILKILHPVLALQHLFNFTCWQVAEHLLVVGWLGSWKFGPVQVRPKSLFLGQLDEDPVAVEVNVLGQRVPKIFHRVIFTV